MLYRARGGDAYHYVTAEHEFYMMLFSCKWSVYIQNVHKWWMKEGIGSVPDTVTSKKIRSEIVPELAVTAAIALQSPVQTKRMLGTSGAAVRPRLSWIPNSTHVSDISDNVTVNTDTHKSSTCDIHTQILTAYKKERHHMEIAATTPSRKGQAVTKQMAGRNWSTHMIKMLKKIGH